MLNLEPEDEALYASFWDGIGTRVSDSGPFHVQITDTRHDGDIVAILPRTLYEYLTIQLMATYGDDDPDFIRASILQDLD